MRLAAEILSIAAEIDVLESRDASISKVAILKHLPSRKKEGKDPWCLVSKKSGKPLQCWPTKPSDEQFAAAERRVQFFKHQG